MSIGNNTEKLNELVQKINSLPVAGSGNGGAVSPTVNITETSNGHNVIITDINGSHSFFIPNGENGQNGDPGFSPTVTVTDISGGYRLTITDVNGKKTIDIPIGGSGSGGQNGVGITAIEQTVTSTVSGGVNEVTVSMSNGENAVFEVRNGERGFNGTSCTHTWNGSVLSISSASGTSSANLIGPEGKQGIQGDQGVGITKVEQTTTSLEDGGINVVTVTLSNGQTFSFDVKNGSKGSHGSKATINGMNTITLETRSGIDLSQNGSALTLSPNLTDILASGKIILREGVDYHYGDTLPPAGNRGRIFLKKKVAE